MKKECDIVQDLLLGYQDHVLHASSNQLVEEHLKHCCYCIQAWQEIQKDSSLDKIVENKQIDYLKNIRYKNKKKTVLLIILAFFLILFVIFNLIVFSYYKQQSSYMQIFLQDTITSEQQEELKSIVLSQDSKAQITYHSKAEALQSLKEKYNGKADNLLESYNQENNPLSAYYTISIHTSAIDNILKELSLLSYISSTQTNIHTNPYTLFFSQFLSH